MTQGPSPREPIRFGPFEVLPGSFDVSRSGTRLHIQEQPYRVLLVLLEHAGEIVTHEQLKAALAPSAEYGDFDHMIRISINKLRSIFSDSASSPRYIETVHGHGYRFIAPLDRPLRPKVGPPVEPEPRPAVAEPTAQPRLRRWRIRALIFSVSLGIIVIAVVLLLVVSAPWDPRPIRSLAVLPLVNLSGDPNQQYLTDGLTEELISNLSGIPGLRVISRTSVMHYREGNTPLNTIARELGVDAVVEGSLQRSENRVRVNVRLVRTSGEQTIWTQSYNREIKDVLSLRDELTATIADQVDIALGPRRSPAGENPRVIKPEAYEAFLRGKYWEHKQQFAKAVENYREAVKIDPSYAQAYASLAHAASTISYRQGLPPSSVSILAGTKAMQLDPDLAEAHTNIGDLKFFWDWDWAAGEAEFRRAIELDPKSVEARSQYGTALWMLGRDQQAESELKYALQLDPLSSSVHLEYVNLLRNRGDYQGALQHLKQILDRDTNHAAVYTTLGETDESLNRHKEAIEAYLQGDSKNGFNVQQIAALRQAYNARGLRGYWTKRLELGQTNNQDHEIPLTETAAMYVHMGDYDRAVEMLEEAYVRRSPLLVSIRSDPEWAPLRSDARYKAIIHRMNFQQ